MGNTTTPEAVVIAITCMNDRVAELEQEVVDTNKRIARLRLAIDGVVAWAASMEMRTPIQVVATPPSPV